MLTMTADNTTKDMSVMLYHFLCQNIVGYEESVKTIRMMHNIMDNLMTTCYDVVITSGSYGEGIDLNGYRSDIDLMKVLKQIEIHENMSLVVHDKKKTYFSINTENTKPGYSYLSFEYTKAIDVLPMCVEYLGKILLSNVLFKERFADEFLTESHGPCLSDKDGIFDYAYCLHSKSWITPAYQWITRRNNSWPTAEIKKNIVDHGVLFVPIGVKGSQNEEVEWRMSFSVGEKLLIYSFSHTQLLCYALLKILMKDVLSTDKQCKGLLCSYFLKTIIFWVSSELNQSVWTPDEVIPCFMRCFRRLIYCVEYSVCPHYFIPDNNLFENKIVGKERRQLLNILNTLHSYDWKCIFVSPAIRQFHLLLTTNARIVHVRHVKYIYSIQKVINSVSIFVLQNLFCGQHFRRRFVRCVHKLFCFQSSGIQLLYLNFMSVLCRCISQAFPLNDTCSGYRNKYKYRQYLKCQSYLLLNMSHDPVSRWLMLASLFNNTKQYNKALDMTSYSLSKCTLEKLCRSKKLNDLHFKLLSLITIRKKGLVRSLTLLNVACCIFEKDSFLVPTELQLSAYEHDYIIPAVVYAHFLRVLCHNNLTNMKQCEDSIRDLQLTIDEEYFIPTTRLKAISYTCLGICMQLIGKTEYAKEAFVLATQLAPREDMNQAFKRLSSISLI